MKINECKWHRSAKNRCDLIPKIPSCEVYQSVVIAYALRISVLQKSSVVGWLSLFTGLTGLLTFY
jgi:hypothetical protein